MADKKKILTLCIIREPGRVLLGMKKRGFGAGRWNGFGGKVCEEETVEAAARRELYEEASVRVKKLKKVGILDFSFEYNSDLLEVHVFKGEGIRGNPYESEEMRPRWFSLDEVPFHEMWPDDKYWFPLFLADKSFRGRFHFGPDDMIVDQALSEEEKIR
ncbi:MAG: 8-oxo-dGTP diphosphatase [bacterium]|nr:8-oxo-dGTP diphosphatase [bacterium]MDZ4299961.1 8-oxo-dGTP diphosphatase [Candidatus Sungbacteria bacterium]